MTIPFAKLRKEWISDPAFRQAYEALAPEFELKSALTQARTRAGLSRAELAERMQTTEAVVARLESGRMRPSTQILERFARATATRLKISFEPTGTGGRDA